MAWRALLHNGGAAKSRRPRAGLRAEAADDGIGALDALTRDRLNEQLLRLWERERRTVVFVTHSIPEAVFLSSRIVVMSPRPGRIVEVIESRLPADRTLDIRETPDFIESRTACASPTTRMSRAPALLQAAAAPARHDVAAATGAAVLGAC
jgi:ABC-type proline/glycine betaine transport system ATPase subunit